MEEIKAPDVAEDVKNVNEEIDIYVFSNGQQYSPPRKYHLRVEELNYWDATLAFLARAQYGSLHSSIELYELDGRKLENSTEIRDCAVYVAVVPPDPFIYAGYDKYLVKASRSFERRLSKKINGEQESSDPNSPSLNQNTTPVKSSGISPQYLNIRKIGEVRKSSIKNSNQKLMDRIKPVANQVSQRIPRKSNITPSALATKNNYITKRDGPKINPKISTTPGTPGKISTSGRGGSTMRPKSPAKILSFDPSSHSKENVAHQKFVNSKHESFTINRKNRDPCNKPNPPSTFKNLKVNNNVSTIKTDDTLSGVRDSIKDESHNQHFNKTEILLDTNKKSINEIPKPAMKERSSVTINMSPVIVDNKLQPLKKDGVSWTDALKLPMLDKTEGQITISTNETSTVTEQIQTLKSNERVLNANKSKVSKIIKEFNDRFNKSAINGIPKATNTQQGYVLNENKLTATEDLLISVDNLKSLISPISPQGSYKVSNSLENYIVIQKPDDSLQLSVTGENSMLNKSDKIKEIKDRDCNVMSKLPSTKIIETTFEDELDLSSKHLNETKCSKRDDSVKVNLDLISILNEARVSTEPQSFILKSEDARESMCKEQFLLIDEIIDQAIKSNNNPNYILQKNSALTMYETSKTNIDPISLADKINVSKVEATPKHEYIDIVLNNKESKVNKARITVLPTDPIHRNENSLSVSDNVYDLKIPMLYHVPEKSLHLIAHKGISDKDAENKNALHSTNKTSPETNMKNEDLNPTKTHSFIFYIKKDNDNTVKVKDIKLTHTNDMLKIPITKMVKDKDVVHINIFRSSINGSISTFIDATDGKPNKNEMKYNKSKNVDKPKLNETDMTTTFINPAWDKNNINVGLKSSKDVSDESESDTDQFIAIVQNGDVVHLKLNIQIKDAAGIIKSTHQIDMRNLSSINQLPSDEINKTPNELTRSKSLQSVENDTPPHLCCRKKDKVVVYQCACCENTNYTLATNPLNPSQQGLYVLLPVVTPLQESMKPQNPRSDKEVQHTESMTKISVVSSVKGALINLPADNVQVKTSENSSKRQTLMEEQGKIRSQLIMMKTEPSQTSSRFNTETKIQQTSKTNQDQSSQTDWCDVLLEARAEPDGHYTFYLPPLHILQQYTLR